MRSTVVLLAAASLLPFAQCTWCSFYYDSACKNPANKQSADCGNYTLNGSGGQYIKCTSTKGNKEACNIAVVGQNSGIGKLVAQAQADGPCVNTGSPGPWYQLWLASSQGMLTVLAVDSIKTDAKQVLLQHLDPSIQHCWVIEAQASYC